MHDQGFAARRHLVLVTRLRTVLVAHLELDLGAECLLVEVQGFFAATIEEEVGRNKHRVSPHYWFYLRRRLSLVGRKQLKKMWTPSTYLADKVDGVYKLVP